jgi:hypothetical protein
MKARSYGLGAFGSDPCGIIAGNDDLANQKMGNLIPVAALAYRFIAD